MKNIKKVIVKDKHEIYISRIIAYNLKKIRGDRHMSQMELASLANLSPNFINEIENEKKCPSIKTLAKLVKALNIEPVRFFMPETDFKIEYAEMLKMELSELITAVLNEKIDRYNSVHSINEPGASESGNKTFYIN